MASMSSGEPNLSKLDEPAEAACALAAARILDFADTGLAASVLAAAGLPKVSIDCPTPAVSPEPPEPVLAELSAPEDSVFLANPTDSKIACASS